VASWRRPGPKPGAPKEADLIALLRGRIHEKKPEIVILDVQGVGYQVHVPLSTFYKLAEPDQEQTLRIHTHVREDVLALYGFASPVELDIFRALLTVRGCGPKIALTVLSGLEPEILLQSLAAGDARRLSTIPGIGKKTADRLILELKEKLAKYLETTQAAVAAAAPSPSAEVSDDIVSALVNLGYNRGQAEAALAHAFQEAPEASFETLLKKSLRGLMKK